MVFDSAPGSFVEVKKTSLMHYSGEREEMKKRHELKNVFTHSETNSDNGTLKTKDQSSGISLMAERDREKTSGFSH